MVFVFRDRLFEDNEKRLTGLVAILGLTFGLFQFWISELNNNRRRQFDLRYEAYKDFHRIIDSITETLNDGMMEKNVDMRGLIAKLLNLVNQFYSSVHSNSDFLFIGLDEKNESKKIKETLQNLLAQTDKLRKEIDKTGKINYEDDDAVVIEKVNWHNQVVDDLKKIYADKHLFYKVLRDYF